MTHKVLIVDDEPMIAFGLEMAFKDAGFEVVGVACNAADAIRMIDAAAIDCVVLDGMLEGTSAAPVAARLRQDGIAFVVASGQSANDIDWLQDARLLQKPFAPEKAVAILEKLLRDDSATLS